VNETIALSCRAFALDRAKELLWRAIARVATELVFPIGREHGFSIQAVVRDGPPCSDLAGLARWWVDAIRER
jgi:hypothetical protein